MNKLAHEYLGSTYSSQNSGNCLVPGWEGKGSKDQASPTHSAAYEAFMFAACHLFVLSGLLFFFLNCTRPTNLLDHTHKQLRPFYEPQLNKAAMNLNNTMSIYIFLLNMVVVKALDLDPKCE